MCSNYTSSTGDSSSAKRNLPDGCFESNFGNDIKKNLPAFRRRASNSLFYKELMSEAVIKLMKYLGSLSPKEIIIAYKFSYYLQTESSLSADALENCLKDIKNRASVDTQFCRKLIDQILFHAVGRCFIDPESACHNDELRLRRAPPASRCLDLVNEQLKFFSIG